MANGTLASSVQSRTFPPRFLVFAVFGIALGLLGAASTPSTVSAAAETADVDAGGVPGAGETVVVARATWDTGWFQAAVLAALLEDLGYVVDGPTTTDNATFYEQVQRGDVDLWANGWFPLHREFLDEGSSPTATAIGAEVDGGALQGYLADRATVERLGIESFADLADPAIASAFDRDGDGVADLIGCNLDWACQPEIDEHLEQLGLTGTVSQISADYGPLMREAVARSDGGESVLFYTFTPNWTVGELVPGQDVVWLPVVGTAFGPESAVEGVVGCLADPCPMGFEPSDIRAVANLEFLDDNPAIAALLEEFEVPLADILAQNALLVSGEDSARDIADHADDWISTNQATVDEWFDAATSAHTTAGRSLSQPPTRSSGRSGEADVGNLRVVTRLDPPFVSYEGGDYQGFSVEVLELVAEDIGANIDLYAVNSSAKLVDDVDRGEAEIGVGAIGITSSREETVDFSYPYFESGLQIMVADRDAGLAGGRFRAVLSAIFSRDLLVLVGVLFVLLVLAAHAIWLTERKHNPEFPESYAEGIWESFWWAAVTATTVGYGDKTPKRPAGRIFGLLWMFSGLFVLAYFTAGIATTFTIDELEGSIGGPADLRRQRVAVPIDSAAAVYVDDQGIAATRYPSAIGAYEALVNDEVDAVVHDAAILKHFVATDPRGGVSLVGQTFAERDFGFVVASGSPLAERIDRSLLELFETGEYDRVHDRWFGTSEDSG